MLQCMIRIYDTVGPGIAKIVASGNRGVVDWPRIAFTHPNTRESPMKKTMTLALVALFACGTAFAADTKSDTKMAADGKMTPQQEKMKTCNDRAKDMKGEERKGFMKTCLSAKPAKPESKMAMCNKKTAGMKADERAKAQSECMKG